MTKTANTAPYFDDFDELKNYHKILYKPGFPVQARELTQSQTILQNQITKLGDSIYQQGSIVIPGNSRGELGVAYVKLNDTYNSVALNMSLFAGTDVKIVGATSGVVATVKAVLSKTSTDPNLLYVAYVSGGVVSGVPNGKMVFDLGEDIYLQSNPTILATVQTGVGAIGLGSMAYINQGVYYVNGVFVSVANQAIVISKYDIVPSCKVLLQIVESFVDSNTDSTLLDPAQGSYNFAAPGADRYKIELVLTSLAYDAVVNENYVEIMRYNAGVLEEHVMFPKYSELEKSLARRSFDEVGNYVVNGLTGTFKEAKKVSVNGGLDPAGSIDDFAVVVAPGRAYINGFEVDTIANKNIILPKARTAAHIKTKTTNVRPVFGRYILVSNIVNGFSIATRQLIQLTDGAGSSTSIGTARVLAIDYLIGDPGTNTAIYKLWLSEVVFADILHSMVNVGGITFTGTLTGTASVIHELTTPLTAGTYNAGNVIITGGTRTATVQYWDAAKSALYVYKHSTTYDTPNSGDQITDATTSTTSVVTAKQAYFGIAQNNTIFPAPVAPVKSFKNASSVYDGVYLVQKQVSITPNGSGNGSVTIADGVFATPEAGTFVAFGTAGVVSPSVFSLSGANNVLNMTGGPTSGTVTIYATVIKTALAPRTKTLTSYTETLTIGSGVTSFNLSKCDVYRLTTVVVGSVDVTSRYVLQNGQTDYAYYLSKIALATGQTLPVGTIQVQYDYFEHTGGDFFTADSYAGNAEYLSLITNYKASDGSTYNLLNCIDCRPTVGTSGTDFGSGAIVGDMLVNDELFNTSIQYFVPRYDVLTIDKDNGLSVVSGIPGERPVVPAVGKDALALETYLIPAYTYSLKQISTTRNAANRYIKQDIKKIENRIANLEQFSLLSSIESDVINYTVTDAATGLDRFKSGYLVENFNSPFTMANVTDQKFVATFNAGNLMSAVERMECSVNVANTSSHVTKVDNLYMLPYTEVSFASQSLSSKITNINPFQIISWTGSLNVSPLADIWTDVVDLPTVFNYTTDTVEVVNWVPAPIPTPPINTPVVIPPTIPPAPIPAVGLVTAPWFEAGEASPGGISGNDPGISDADASSGAAAAAAAGIAANDAANSNDAASAAAAASGAAAAAAAGIAAAGTDGQGGGGGSGGGCFLTTATVNALGLPDDCEELQLARSLRDNKMSSGKAKSLVDIYYTVGPVIVSRKTEWMDFYAGVVLPVTRLVKKGNHEKAIAIYTLESIKLVDKFASKYSDKAIIEKIYSKIVGKADVNYNIKFIAVKLYMKAYKLKSALLSFLQ